MKLLPFVSLINQVLSKKNPAEALLAKGLFSRLEEPWSRDTNKPARRVQCLQPEQASVSNIWPVATATQHCRARKHGDKLSIIIPSSGRSSGQNWFVSVWPHRCSCFIVTLPLEIKKKTSIWEHWDYWTWVHCVRYFHKHFTRLAISWWSAGGSRNHRNILVTSVVFDSRLLQVLQLLSWVQRRMKSTSYALWIFKWLASKRIPIITHILIWIQQLFTFSVTNSVTVSTE